MSRSNTIRRTFAVAMVGCALVAGGARLTRNPFAARKMEGVWCSLGTSISWYNDNVKGARGRFTKGYQTRVMEVLAFDGFVNAAINGGTIVNQANLNVPAAAYYTIEHGINDWGQSTPVGTIGDYRGNTGNKTFYANYRKLIDKIRAANPAAKVVLCTPRRGYSSGAYIPANSETAKNDIYLREYAEAVRKIAAEEGFPVADFFATCGTDAELKALSIDEAIHPNDAGFQRMADELLRAFATVD